MAEYAVGRRALGICDRCGFAYKLNTLRELFVRTNATNLLVCKSCWEPSHPQLEQGAKPIHDPQALRRPRPDTARGVDEE